MKYYKTKGGIIAVSKPIDGEEITAEEYSALKSGIKTPVWTDAMQERFERTRPLTEAEVSRMLIAEQINTLSVDDNTALRMMEFYPDWAANIAYTVGFKVRYNSKLWRVVQAHTSLVGWEPTAAASLWEQINETHAGTEDDPIPYSGNMALESGKYYMQDYVVYLCVRDSVIPVHDPLSKLVEWEYVKPV